MRERAGEIERLSEMAPTIVGEDSEEEEDSEEDPAFGAPHAPEVPHQPSSGKKAHTLRRARV